MSKNAFFRDFQYFASESEIVFLQKMRRLTFWDITDTVILEKIGEEKVYVKGLSGE